MSKSEVHNKGKIEICDSPEAIIEKVKKAVTDNNPSITYNPIERPGISNLIEILSAVTETDPDRIVEECSGLDTVQFKNRVSESVVEYFRPIRIKFIELKEDKSFIKKVLSEGEKKTQEISDKTMDEVRTLMGLKIY